MVIDSEGFVSWASRARPGPIAKTYTNVNKMLGVVCHSMEGWLAGSFGELDKLTRPASWCFSIALDGTLYQHYPVWASCWASGNFTANTSLISVESEGVAGTPLNAAQVATMLRLGQDLEAYRGWKLKRGTTLWEHNEVALWDTENAGPTSCPSHRYDPYFAALEEEMADPRVDAIIAALGGQAAIDAWNVNGNSLLAGYGIEQADQNVAEQKIDEHIANHAAGVTGQVTEHTHAGGKVNRP